MYVNHWITTGRRRGPQQRKQAIQLYNMLASRRNRPPYDETHPENTDVVWIYEASLQVMALWRERLADMLAGRRRLLDIDLADNEDCLRRMEGAPAIPPRPSNLVTVVLRAYERTNLLVLSPLQIIMPWTALLICRYFHISIPRALASPNNHAPIPSQ